MKRCAGAYAYEGHVIFYRGGYSIQGAMDNDSYVNQLNDNNPNVYG